MHNSTKNQEFFILFKKKTNNVCDGVLYFFMIVIKYKNLYKVCHDFIGCDVTAFSHASS